MSLPSNNQHSSAALAAAKIAAGLCLALTPAFSQITTINLGTQVRNPDFSTMPVTRPATVTATLPSTCLVGQVAFNTAAPAGSNLFGCTAPNVWTLQGGSAAIASATPATLSFGSQNIGSTSASQAVVLANQGNVALTINSIAISGNNRADFPQNTNCASILPAGSTCTISASFTPSVTGAESAILSVTTANGNVSPSIPLSGTGASSSSSPHLTPSILSTPVGSNLSISADSAVSWSLASGSAGTLSTGSGSSVIYTPPASVTPQNARGGCMVTPNDSVFNTRIDNLPLSSNSAGWTSYMGTTGISFLFSWGTNILDNTASQATESFHYTTLGNGTFLMPPAATRKRETGALTTDSNNDHHMVSLNRQNCQFYETYQDGIPVSGCPTCTAASGWQYSSTSYAQPGLNSGGGTTDAAGLPLEPLTVHLSEIKAGTIKHALRFTLCTGCININTILWPATTANGSNTPAAPPLGARFRLKSSYPTTGVYGVNVPNNGSGYTSAPTVTISGCTTAPAATATLSGTGVQSVTVTNPGAGCTNPTVSFSGTGSGATAVALVFNSYAQTVLTALQRYGMFLSDNGGSNQIEVDDDVTEDPNVIAAFNQLTAATIKSGNFEVVDESSLMLNVNSSAVNPNNGYVTPASFALLTATDSNGNKTSTPIALQPVLVGTPNRTLTVMAGTPGYQMQSWVTGSSNQTVAWTLTSGVGSITSAGVYTAPATVSSPSVAVLTAQAVADSNAATKVYLNIIPSGNNPTGSIRIDVGNSSQYTDSSGNVWLADMLNFDTGSLSVQNDNYPTNAWGNLTDAALYQTYFYTWGDDISYGPFVVPNGNYKVALSLAEGGCSGTFSTSPIDNGLIIGPLVLESQGQVGAHFDLGKAVNYACRTPYTVNVPAQVTNNLLYVAVRATGGANAHSIPLLNALAILPDTTAAHLAIDGQQVTSVTAGSTVQLYPVGWYMSNAVTWSVSGGGSINSNGLYTAPSTAPTSDQTVTVTATSTVNTSINATFSLTLKSN